MPLYHACDLRCATGRLPSQTGNKQLSTPMATPSASPVPPMAAPWSAPLNPALVPTVVLDFGVTLRAMVGGMFLVGAFAILAGCCVERYAEPALFRWRASTELASL